MQESGALAATRSSGSTNSLSWFSFIAVADRPLVHAWSRLPWVDHRNLCWRKLVHVVRNDRQIVMNRRSGEQSSDYGQGFALGLCVCGEQTPAIGYRFINRQNPARETSL
jgi:hypothetical protein